MSYTEFFKGVNLFHFLHLYGHSWIAMSGIQNKIFWGHVKYPVTKIWASLGSWLYFLSKTGKIWGTFWPVPVIPEFGSWRLKHQKLRDILGYIMSSCPLSFFFPQFSYSPPRETGKKKMKLLQVTDYKR